MIGRLRCCGGRTIIVLPPPAVPVSHGSRNESDALPGGGIGTIVTQAMNDSIVAPSPSSMR